LIVAYGYVMEAFMSWYSGNFYERFMYWNRMTGPYGWSYAMLIGCNILIPQLLWSRRVRQNIPMLFLLSLAERFAERDEAGL
jgi:molybdopterin-containing oxidoreductase family membrane subunit